jgi:PilZ domain
LIERRQESRTRIDLQLEVWGTDARGESFQQIAHARDISLRGALLSLDGELRSSDLIGILYAGRKARYRVVWVSGSGSGRTFQAAVHRVAVDECPWKSLFSESPVVTTPADNSGE